MKSTSMGFRTRYYAHGHQFQAMCSESSGKAKGRSLQRGRYLTRNATAKVSGLMQKISRRAPGERSIDPVESSGQRHGFRRKRLKAVGYNAAATPTLVGNVRQDGH